jgi:hypothetical protein
MKDLIDTRTDMERLTDWMRTKRYVRTSEVIKWGSENYSNRALRNAQAFAQKNPARLRRLTDDEKHRHFGYIKEDVWEVL